MPGPHAGQWGMAEPSNPRPSLAPRNWPGWLAVGRLWFLGVLPPRLGRALVAPLGPLMRVLMTSRRRIAECNIQRCFPDASPVDAREARAAGRYGAELAAQGDVDGSIAIVRTSPVARGALYSAELRRIPLGDVAAKTRHMPDEFLKGHNNVSDAFLDWAAPLVGEMPVFERF